MVSSIKPLSDRILIKPMAKEEIATTARVPPAIPAPAAIILPLILFIFSIFLLTLSRPVLIDVSTPPIRFIPVKIRAIFIISAAITITQEGYKMGLLLIIILFIIIFWFFTKDLGRDLRLFAGWLESLPAKTDKSINTLDTLNTKMESLTAELQAKLDLKKAEKAAKKP